MIMKKSESADVGGMLDTIKKIEAAEPIPTNTQHKRTKTERIGSFFRRSSNQIDVPQMDQREARRSNIMQR